MRKQSLRYLTEFSKGHIWGIVYKIMLQVKFSQVEFFFLVGAQSNRIELN